MIEGLDPAPVSIRRNPRRLDWRSPLSCPSLITSPAACLFDLDGLLLDTEPLHGRGWAEAAVHFGGELNQEQLLQLKGRRRQDCAEQVNAWLPSPVGTTALLDIQQPIVRALLPDARAMPSAEKLVRHCWEVGIPMALVTSSSREAVAFKARPHPWLALIQQRVYGDDHELQAGKPDPAPYQLAAERLGQPTRSCWAFEDSQAGTESAHRAGCQVWVLTPDPPHEHPPSNPCRIPDLGVVLDQLINTGG